MIKSYISFRFKCILQVLLFLSVFLAFLCVATYIKYDTDVVSSVLCGGITIVIPSFLFIIVFFFKDKKTLPKGMVRIFYLAGIAKIISLILVCLVMFSFIGIASPIGYFISLFFTQIMFWVGCLLFFSEDMNIYEFK
ncbi:MAG: ATP synthase subunit I [Enterobacteriaceae bacterium]|nr:ATP synthase subunit I [Enterobacteriaceae bacterium]